jgi:hypothetical protein
VKLSSVMLDLLQTRFLLGVSNSSYFIRSNRLSFTRLSCLVRGLSRYVVSQPTLGFRGGLQALVSEACSVAWWLCLSSHDFVVSCLSPTSYLLLATYRPRSLATPFTPLLDLYFTFIPP